MPFHTLPLSSMPLHTLPCACYQVSLDVAACKGARPLLLQAAYAGELGVVTALLAAYEAQGVIQGMTQRAAMAQGAAIAEAATAEEAAAMAEEEAATAEAGAAMAEATSPHLQARLEAITNAEGCNALHMAAKAFGNGRAHVVVSLPSLPSSLPSSPPCLPA